jgi:hypothetical protein
MREIMQRIDEETRKSVQKELDALEDAIERADLVEVLRHKLILEVLLGQQSSSPKSASDSVL